jgi:hypothetical protein
MTRSGIRIIPQVEDPITQLTQLAVDQGWHLKSAVARDVACGSDGEMTFFVPDGETYIYLCDDLFVGFQYFIIVGLAQERVADVIRNEFNAREISELFARWDRGVASGTADDRVDAVLFLGVDSPETPREEYTSRIRSALVDEHKDVRNAAVAAVGYTDWSIFRPDVQRVAATDVDPKARERARFLLKAWDKQDRVSRA